MFIGSSRPDVKINDVKGYFYSKREKESVGFYIAHEGKNQTFRQLSEAVVRDFREYAIPTIEIDLDVESSLDEVINLFVDINQQGEKVKRFDIVKAIGRGNKLLSSSLDLIATKQRRKNDIFYKKRHTVFTRVLQRLQNVQSVEGANQKVDRMWERIVELVLFCRTRKHRTPGQILRSFIRSTTEEEKTKISVAELKRLRTVFNFLSEAYANTPLGETRLATDTPHFYTMVTSLLRSKLLVPSEKYTPDREEILRKLLAFAHFLPDSAEPPRDRYLAECVEDYKKAATRQTTHPGQRDIREKRFLEVIKKL